MSPPAPRSAPPVGHHDDGEDDAGSHDRTDIEHDPPQTRRLSIFMQSPSAELGEGGPGRQAAADALSTYGTADPLMLSAPATGHRSRAERSSTHTRGHRWT